MKTAYLFLLRLVVHTIGRWSNGVALCLDQGLTSGIMLEYIYRNKASGKFLIGKMLDHVWLSHSGWECIRVRKQHTEELLDQAINSSLGKKQGIFVVDVASGPARYMLDVMTRHKDQDVRSLCRDLDERWLAEGRGNARQLGLASVTFERGDALDRESFRSLPTAPDIVVSSGFYDWIVDDELIRKSMKIISEVIKPGGYFVFTHLTGHVDMRLVSEIFPDFNKQPLRMVVRPLDIVQDWARGAGFKVLETKQDRWGYHAVTLAVADGK